MRSDLHICRWSNCSTEIKRSKECMYVVYYCFFFQAEDGIRGAQESRGLGDVYKRQEAKAALLKAIPDWNAEKANDVTGAARHYGASDEALSLIHL